jgi:protein-histidine pros-kinase
MDVQMPEMDGLEATRRIRALETSRRVPIIAQTAHAFSEDRARCVEAGMDDYISKPLKASELQRIIGRFTCVCGSGFPRPDHEGECAGFGKSTPPARWIFNLDALKERLNGDEEAVVDTVRLFLQHIPMMLEEMRSAALSGDREKLIMLAHKLKGASATFGAERLADMAAEVECPKRGSSGDIQQSVSSRLDEELHELKQRLEELGYHTNGRPYSQGVKSDVGAKRNALGDFRRN